jgi:hypothetical protein
VALKKQREGAPGGADIDGLPQPVQNKHVLVQRGIHGVDGKTLSKQIEWVNYA